MRDCSQHLATNLATARADEEPIRREGPPCPRVRRDNAGPVTVITPENHGCGIGVEIAINDQIVLVPDK